MYFDARLLIIPFALVAPFSCEGEDEESDECIAEITSGSQFENKYFIKGKFNLSQPVMTLKSGNITYVRGGDVVGPKDANFDITDVPAGVYTATWRYSCLVENGNYELHTTLTQVKITR